MNFKKAFLLIFGIFAIFSLATAQQRTIAGTVTDKETGEALLGVTVIDKEARNNGTITDFDGKFSIKVGQNSTALLFSYTGYEAVEQPILGQNALNVFMSTNAILKEVVVIGYGTIKKEDATGLVQSVDSKSFNKGNISSAQELLAGKIAGVAITTDGSPGGGAKIRIRGESSLAASNDPLVVVDGIPIENSSVSGGRNALSVVNPNDIETITVLKDASSTAIYGSRASGGVILITTKKGKLGKKLTVGYSANVSLGKISKRVDVLTADEFRAAVLKKYDGAPETQKVKDLLGTASTDWQDLIYQDALSTDHSLNASGGIGAVPYRVSVGYTRQNGLLKTDKFDRYTTAVNLNPGFLHNTLQINLNFKSQHSKNHFADRGAIGSALSFDPTKSARDTTTKFGNYTTWQTNSGIPNDLAPVNPLSLLDLRDDNSEVARYITSGSVDYRMPFLPALRANLNLAYDYSHGKGKITTPSFAPFAFDPIFGGGIRNQYSQTKKNSLLDFYLNYKKGFGKHDVDLMGGYSWQHFENVSQSYNTNLAGTPQKTDTDTLSHPSELFLVSLFARANYGFDDKILVTASIRQDATSRFGPTFRRGLFPSAAVAVKLLQNEHRYFNTLKWRVSWGVTGQQDVGDNNFYAYFPIYLNGQGSAQYQFGQEFYNTIRPNGYSAALKWEETSSYNTGFDFSLVRNRIGGSVDIYNRFTTDLLNKISLPALSNLTNEGIVNIGKMESRGIELNLNLTPISTKKVSWDLNANFAINRSKITKLTVSDDPNYAGVPTGGIAGGVGSNIQNHQVGYAPNSFFVKKQKYDENGVFLPGEFENLNGDTIVDAKDMYRYKNPAPRFTMGLTSNLSIGNFDFSAAGRVHYGNFVYNNVQTDMGYLDRLYGTTGYLVNVNQSAVDLGADKQSDLTFSDHFVTDASFFKLDHVTLGYNFRKIPRISSFRVYATAQNPLVVTKYKGIDPEIGNGIDNQTYPRPRNYVVGLSLNF